MVGEDPSSERATPAHSQACFPLVTNIRRTDLHERFSLTLERQDSYQIRLKATPRCQDDGADLCEIQVILNVKTYMTYATQRIAANKDRTISVMEEQKVNQRPTDRDAMMNPDLSGFRQLALDFSDIRYLFTGN